jgi:V8-like Glu-specific endopeptidase
VPVGCTGWIADNGKYVTAGHCLSGNNADTFQFNVPSSNSDRTLNHPGPEDQYPVIANSRVYTNGGVGNDWGIFAVSDNSNTGLQPIDAQNASFSVVQDLGPNTIRITGFGVDDGSDNQTNQTHSGSNTGSSGTTMRYSVDTTGGNSGSPVIDGNSSTSVGIHTHGGCSSSGGNNSGTSAFHSDFWSALTGGGGGGGCAAQGDSCVLDSDCCSNKCKGKAGSKVCK